MEAISERGRTEEREPQRDRHDDCLRNAMIMEILVAQRRWGRNRALKLFGGRAGSTSDARDRMAGAGRLPGPLRVKLSREGEVERLDSLDVRELVLPAGARGLDLLLGGRSPFRRPLSARDWLHAPTARLAPAGGARSRGSTDDQAGGHFE